MYFVFNYKSSDTENSTVEFHPTESEHALIRGACLISLLNAATGVDTAMPEKLAFGAVGFLKHADTTPSAKVIVLTTDEARGLQQLLFALDDFAIDGSKDPKLTARSMANAISIELDAHELRTELSRISSHHFNFQT